METVICSCDLDLNCGQHENDGAEWAHALGIKPTPFDAWDAYEGGYKGKYFEGWV